MKVRDLIDKLYNYSGNMDIALGDFQFNCCNENINIEDDFYVDEYGELYNKADYDENEWNEIFDDLKRIILIV